MYNTSKVTAILNILVELWGGYICTVNRRGLGRLAAWHLPGGPVCPPARWAATSNVEGGGITKEG